MGAVVGLLGIFLVWAVIFVLLALIAGEWGVMIGVLLLAAALVRAVLNAWQELNRRLERMEQKLDALQEQRNRSDAE